MLEKTIFSTMQKCCAYTAVQQVSKKIEHKAEALSFGIYHSHSMVEYAFCSASAI